MKETKLKAETQNSNFIKDDEIDLLRLIGVLFRYKWWIIVITFVSAMGTVGFSIITLILPPEKSPLPNVYKPSALILINEENSSSAASMLSASGIGNLAGLAGVSAGSSYGQLAEKLIKSKSTLDVVVDEFDVARKYGIEQYVTGNARNALISRLSINYEADTSTLTIAYEDYDPVYARDIVNRFVELLDDRFASIGGNQNLTKKNLLEQKLAEVEVEIVRHESEIQKFQKKHGTLDVESLAREQVTAIAQLRSQLILKDMEIKTYSSFTIIDDPVLKRMKAERENLFKLISEMESGYSEYESIMPPQDELPSLALDFEHLKRNLEVQVRIYEILSQQYEIAKLNVEGEEPIFQVLELADVPDLKSGPRRSVICIGVTVASFFFSIVLAFILNAIKNIRNDPERMRRLKGDN